MERGTLYIIGNGFDLHFGLKTRKETFVEILKQQDIYNESDRAIEIFEQYGISNWGEYENALSDIELDLIEERNLESPNYLSEHEYDRDGVITNMELYLESLSDAIKNSLSIMIKNANRYLQSIDYYNDKLFKSTDCILSFNYTDTVEKLFRIFEETKVLHIHGLYSIDEELIFGYKHDFKTIEYQELWFDVSYLKEIENQIVECKNDYNLSAETKKFKIGYLDGIRDNLTRDRDYYIDTQRELIISFYKSWKKEIQREKLEDFISRCNNIKQVVVMGHSMSEVDSEYMELIEKRICPEAWYISQHQGEPTKKSLDSYSFANKVVFYDLDSLLR